MILLDNRRGSIDLHLPLIEAGLPVDLTTLEFGDLAFTGRGEGGCDVWIGVEHKRFPDFLDGMTTGRLPGHQLPGLRQSYDRAYLVVEGAWTHDGEGRVVGPTRTGHYTPFAHCPSALVIEQQLLTLEIRGGLRTSVTPDQRTSIRWLSALYHWWTDQDLDDHRSHLAVYAPDADRALLTPMSDFRRAITMLLPGIGLTGSRSVESHFGGSLRRMLAASPDEWAALELQTDSGIKRRVGKKRAERIFAVVQR